MLPSPYTDTYLDQCYHLHTHTLILTNVTISIHRHLSWPMLPTPYTDSYLDQFYHLPTQTLILTNVTISLHRHLILTNVAISLHRHLSWPMLPSPYTDTYLDQCYHLHTQTLILTNVTISLHRHLSWPMLPSPYTDTYFDHLSQHSVDSKNKGVSVYYTVIVLWRKINN
jgi:hypothetical protein